MDRRQQNIVLFVLGGLSAIGPFAVDMYLPGFSAIGRDLKTTATLVGFTLTSYTLGIAIGMLAAGPILDRYGRKRPITIGMLLYVLTTAGCIFVPSIYLLISLRFFLALGCCVGMVGSNAIVRDLFSGKEIARALSVMMMIFGVAPIIAPAVGGMIVAAAGWRAIFLVLAVIGLLVVIAVRILLPETKDADVSISLRPREVQRGYVEVMKEHQFVIYASVAGAGSGTLFSYITGSPFVFIDLFGFSARQYGWIFGTNALAIVVAGQINRLLLKRFSPAGILFAITGIQSAIALFLLAGTWMGLIDKFATLALVACYVFCFGFILTNGTALCLQPFSRNAGSASALSGSFLMVTGTVASALVSYLHDGTAFPMTLIMCLSAVSGLILTGTEALRRRKE